MAKNYDVMTELRKRVSKRGEQKTFAAQVPCSQGFLSDVLAGKRQPSDEIVAALGLEKTVIYRKKGAAS